MAHVTCARFERPLDASARLGVPGLDSFRSAPPCSATTFLVTSCGGWSGSARHGADCMERWLRELHPSEVCLRVSVRQLAQTGFALAIPVGIYTFNGHADGLLGAVRVLKRLAADIYIYILQRGRELGSCRPCFCFFSRTITTRNCQTGGFQSPDRQKPGSTARYK